MLLSFSCLLMLHQDALGAEINGIVLVEDGPLEGVLVKAYGRMSDISGGTPLYISEQGDKPGQYRLELPQGKYFITAEGKKSGESFFSFHGANPVQIQEDKLWLPFAAVPRIAVVKRSAVAAKISGTVSYHGVPVSDALVSVYPASDEQFKGLGLMTSSTSADGSFTVPISAGSYTVVARKRSQPFGSMPLRKGDLFCFHSDNPLTVAEKQEAQIEIPCYPRDDVQSFLATTATVKKTREEFSRFRNLASPVETSTVTVRGRVNDTEGRPVPGISIQAYRATNETPFQMHYLRVMPDRQTEADSSGSYSITLPPGVAYYLVAREYSGMAPAKGELYGLYEGNVDHLLESGAQATNADIIVGRLMSAGEAVSQQPLQGGPDPRPVTSFRDTVIDRDATWSGQVEISGRVLVRRGVTLTILPGTTVSFRKIDNNGDGIGDSELRILGLLNARGSAGKPVRFRSAEKNPKAGDWSYLLVFAANGVTVLDHCIVEHAYTGLQVHFSQARVTNSTFRGNNEGIRFGRAELEIEYNEIIGNRYGIRHTRLEGPVMIQYNTIRENDVGIFLVPSNQNVVNFGETFAVKDSPAPVQPTVRFNNLAGNRLYAYSLGERQGYDIDLGRNWWGSTSVNLIRKKVFDKERDPSLGRVRIAPYLQTPVQRANPKKLEGEK